RGASPRSSPAPIWRAWATRSRRHAAPSPGCRGCGTTRCRHPTHDGPVRGRTSPVRGRYAAPGERDDPRPDGDADPDPRRRRDAAIHARGHQCDGQGPLARRDPRDGASIILANTYHLYLRPGHERIARLGGLHAFMDWDRPILTDSGGFQVVSLGDLRVVDEDGATFRSHLDGSLHRFTPEHAIGVQEALGSDVAVAFDQPVTPSSPRAIVAEATERTHRWAERSLAAHGRPDQALFGIVQGGLEPDLRAESTRFIASLPFDGICIGGLAGDETPIQRGATLDVAVGALANDPRPRYLMGLGSPADLLDAVDRGVDLFDSV